MTESVYRWQGPPSVELFRTAVTLPTGHAYQSHALVTCDGRRGVVVVARCGEHVLLARTYRPTVGRDMWELPRGFGETDQGDPSGPVLDAVRELREEAGYTAIAPTDVGGYVTDSSILPTEVRVIVWVIDPAEVPAPTDDEASELMWVPWARVSALIADGTLADAHSLAALAIIGAQTPSIIP